MIASRILFASILLISLASCAGFKMDGPPPREEFRGVWVATVANIDWPENGNDPWTKKQQDFLKILDFYEDLKFNALVVQIRTAGDAFYPTNLAPWSRFFTGEEGRAPQDSLHDPLEWMIEVTHKRGMQFHAWLNPYRATTSLDTTLLAESHDFYRHPEWMRLYGKKFYYDPGLPEVQQHLVQVMAEVVSRYDIDAIHFDDYFYPYKIQGEVFDDSTTFRNYALAGQSLDDWRRSNVDSLISKIHHNIQDQKPWVQFGISPFGVWKNKATDPRGSDTKAGQTTYEDLYADPLSWMEHGWIDYLVPQVYWSLDFEPAAHRKIVSWWAGNTQNSNLYIGNGAYKIRNNADKAWKKKYELPRQMALARNTAAVNGNVFFSARSLINQHRDIQKIFRKKIYPYPALPPVSPLAGKESFEIPEISINDEQYYLRIEMNLETLPDYALVYGSKNPLPADEIPTKYLLDKIHLDGRRTFTLGKSLLKGKEYLSVSFLDRFGRETAAQPLNLNQPPVEDGTKR